MSEESRRQAEEDYQERFEDRTLLSYCWTDDEYMAVQRGERPARVVARYEASKEGGRYG